MQRQFKDLEFKQGEGGFVDEDGKSQWPALVRVKVRRDRALSTALELLNALNQSYPADEDFVELTMFGSIEEIAA